MLVSTWASVTALLILCFLFCCCFGRGNSRGLSESEGRRKLASVVGIHFGQTDVLGPFSKEAELAISPPWLLPMSLHSLSRIEKETLARFEGWPKRGGEMDDGMRGVCGGNPALCAWLGCATIVKIPSRATLGSLVRITGAL